MLNRHNEKNDQNEYMLVFDGANRILRKCSNALIHNNKYLWNTWNKKEVLVETKTY